MFSFFRKKAPLTTEAAPALSALPTVAAPPARLDVALPEVAPAAPRQGWLDKLKAGLRKTGSSMAAVFTGTLIDDNLYEELETALLMADTGVKATAHLLQDLKRRVKDSKTTEPQAVKGLLIECITDLLTPLQKTLAIGAHQPPVIMVAGVNGAGDAFAAGLLYFWHEGKPVEDALRLGHATAAASMRAVSTSASVVGADAALALAKAWGFRADPVI
jgi:fused signal recognition particle receptor